MNLTFVINFSIYGRFSEFKVPQKPMESRLLSNISAQQPDFSGALCAKRDKYGKTTFIGHVFRHCHG